MNRSLLIALLLLCGAGFSVRAKTPGPAPHQRHHRRHRTQARFPHRQSVLAFAGPGAVDELAIGAGVEYQHFIDRRGTFSVVVPVAAFLGGTVAFGEIDGGETRTKLYGFYTAPGMRYHPFGNDRRADLALGLSLPIGIMHRRDEYMSNWGYQITERQGNHFMGGITGQASVDFHARSHPAVFGVFASGGYLYARTQRYFPAANTSEGIYLQFGLRLGGYW